MYLYDKNHITYFAETDRRNRRIPFGIKAGDRTRHMYIIGKTGMGKSTMIENMAVQDIRNGEGFAFVDPHGKSAALLLDYIPPERVKDVVYFAPFDMDNPISFNVMEDVGPDKRHLVANGLMSAFKKIWGPETWSARMEYILMNALLALLEYPDSTLLGVNRMLTDKAYRKKVVDNVKDPSVKTYWTDEFAKYSEAYAKDATPAIQNKLGQFTSNPLIRNIIGQPHSSFDLRKMMDERKILIVNLSKGQLGEGNANLLGGMIIVKIYLAAMSRADLTEGELKKLPNFYMYVDEFQSFANESFADILSEARKYKLALVVAHQYIKQMDEKVADAVFGNVGTQIMFRVGAPDAEVLEKEYAPVFTAEDMVSLGVYQIYLKLMIDGVASHPFSAVTMGPIVSPEKSSKDAVIESSRRLYGHSRAKIEDAIARWYAGSEAPSTFAHLATSAAPASRSSPPYHSRATDTVSSRPNISAQHSSARVVAPMKTPEPAKSVKPFAEAFKSIVREPVQTPSHVQQREQVAARASLPSLQQKAFDHGAISYQSSKGPSEKNMHSLKDALSGILKDNTSPKPVPLPPPSPSKAVPAPEQGRPREVPEEVLQAILRGDE
jgi:hypothetical protein